MLFRFRSKRARLAAASVLACALFSDTVVAQDQQLIFGASSATTRALDSLAAQMGVARLRDIGNGQTVQVLDVPPDVRPSWLAQVEKIRRGSGDLFTVQQLAGDYRSLFHPVEAGMTVDPAQEKVVRDLSRLKGVESISVVDIAPATLQRVAFMQGFDERDGFAVPGSLRLLLEPGREVAFARQSVVPVATGVVWSGIVAKAAGEASTARDHALLVVHGDSVTGTAEVDGRAYDIIALGNGRHAVARRSVVQREEHPPRFTAMEKQKITQDQPPVVVPGVSETPRIDVLVAFSRPTRAQRPDREALAQLAVTQLNQSLTASGVAAVQVRLAGTLDVAYDEQGPWERHLDRLVNAKDKVFAPVHKRRAQLKADVVILLLGDDQYCGEARAIGASAATAFAVVAHSCAAAENYYSFSHEFGHLVGAHHDRTSDPEGVPAWAHGFVNQTKWRTLMSYDVCQCERVPYWSNPNILIDGDPAGVLETEFDARMWMDNAIRVAAFR